MSTEPSRKLLYAKAMHPKIGLVWLCCFNDKQRSYTGMGDTPDAAYENLKHIEVLMLQAWPSPQLH